MLPKKIDFESTFVTFDIASLYMNISHDLGPEAISYWTNKGPEDLTEYINTDSRKNLLSEE